jgi:hypothetical protein
MEDGKWKMENVFFDGIPTPKRKGRRGVKGEIILAIES